ncbi:MAG: shikimate kinase [Syntrophobacteria bacterium]
MRLSLIGMAGAGKSYWSMKLAAHGFTRFCCDDLIAEMLSPQLTLPDGTAMELGEWMGFPSEPGYRERESEYLACEVRALTEVLDFLEDPEKDFGKDIVVDTTGSVIYTGDRIFKRLRRTTTVVYLSTPPELLGQMLRAYLARPGPMLWQGIFSKEPEQSNQEAVAHCYPKLFFARKRLYERYAHLTLDHRTRSRAGFGARSFLEHIRRTARDNKEPAL